MLCVSILYMTGLVEQIFFFLHVRKISPCASLLTKKEKTSKRQNHNNKNMDDLGIERADIIQWLEGHVKKHQLQDAKSEKEAYSLDCVDGSQYLGCNLSVVVRAASEKHAVLLLDEYVYQNTEEQLLEGCQWGQGFESPCPHWPVAQGSCTNHRSDVRTLACRQGPVPMRRLGRPPPRAGSRAPHGNRHDPAPRGDRPVEVNDRLHEPHRVHDRVR